LSGWNPALDLYEDKDNLLVKVELPGMKRETSMCPLHEGSLSISGERKSEQKPRGRRGLSRGAILRALPAGRCAAEPVAADKVKAQYKDGILTITCPRPRRPSRSILTSK